MPMMKGGIWCHVLNASYCERQPDMLGPDVVFDVTFSSDVMPFCASATTDAQSTAARSVGVRARFARILAR